MSLFSRKAAKPPPPPMPPWLKWGVIAFVVLAFVMQGLGIHAPGSKTANLHWGLPSIEAYKAQLMPGNGRAQVSEVAPGEGAEAVCGQDVDIRYGEIAGAAKPGALPQVQLKPLSLRLGSAALPQALQETIIGMKPGGRRGVLLPPEGNGPPQRYAVELVKASPALPAADAQALPFRIFERKESAQPQVRCGDTVNALLTVWDLSGHKLLDMQANKATPLSLHLGEGSVMLGLEMGVHGMSADGERTLIIPPSLQAPLRPAKNSAGSAAEILHNLPLPPHQAIMVDVDLVP